MDEHELAELFRDAVRDTPPASFDERDIAAASHRATARHRARVLVGSGAVVLALLGAGVVGYGLTARQNSSAGMTVAENESAGQPDTTGQLRPLDAPAPHNTDPDGTLDNRRSGPPPKSIPESSSKQGDENTGSASQSAGGTPTGCGQVDRELAVALANELPVAPGTVPSPVDGTCPAGARAASYLVRDNGGTLGVVSIVVVPAGGDPNAPMPLDLPSVDGSARATAPTGSGGQLIVVSQPQQGSTSAPFADRINQIASQLATRY